MKNVVHYKRYIKIDDQVGLIMNNMSIDVAQ